MLCSPHSLNKKGFLAKSAPRTIAIEVFYWQNSQMGEPYVGPACIRRVGRSYQPTGFELKSSGLVLGFLPELSCSGGSFPCVKNALNAFDASPKSGIVSLVTG